MTDASTTARATAAAAASARRVRLGSAQRVSDAAHRLDQPRPAVRLGLAPQVADVDVERVRCESEVVSPDALEDHRAREHLTGIPQEELEQVELPCSSIPLAGSTDFACSGSAPDRRSAGSPRRPARPSAGALSAGRAALRARTASGGSRRRPRRAPPLGSPPRCGRSASARARRFLSANPRQTSRPSTPGIRTSRITASGWPFASSRWSASAPSTASSTS